MNKKIILSFCFNILLFAMPSFSETAEELFKKGNDNISQNKFEDAEKNFLDAIKIKPKYSDAYIELGVLYKRKKQENKALEYFDKAVEIDPKKVNYFKIKNAYDVDQNYDIPVKYYKNYIDKYPEENDYILNELYSISEELSDDGKQDKSLEIQNYLLEKFSKSPKLNSNLAVFHIKHNNLIEFKKYVEKTLSYINYRDIFYDDYLRPISNSLIEENKYNEAILFLNKANKKHPNSNIYHEIAMIYQKINNNTESEKNLIKSLEINQLNNDALDSLGLFYVEEAEKLSKKDIISRKKNDDLIKSKIFKAYELFKTSCSYGSDEACEYQDEKILELIKKYNILSSKNNKNNKMSAYDYFLSGFLNLENSKLNEAEKDLKTAIKLNPKLDIAYVKLGNVYKDKGNNKLALSFYQNAVKINPKQANGYNNIGYIYSEEENYVKAFFYFNKAYELDKTSFTFKDNLINLKMIEIQKYSSEEDYDNLIKTYTELIKIEPNSSDYYSKRGGCYLVLRNFIKSGEDLKIALEIDRYNYEAKYQLGNLILLKLEEDADDIQTKFLKAEEYILESCENNDNYCDLKNLIEVKKVIEIAETNEKSDKIEKYSELGKENLQEKNLQNAVKNFKLAYYLSNNDRETQKELLDTMFKYYMYLKENKEDDKAKEILNEQTKLFFESKTPEELEFISLIANADKLLKEKKFDQIINILEKNNFLDEEDENNKELVIIKNDILLKAYVGEMVEIISEKKIIKNIEQYVEISKKAEPIFQKIKKINQEYLKFDVVFYGGQLILEEAEKEKKLGKYSEFIEKKDDLGAEKELENILKLEPKNFIALSELGNLNIKLNKIDKGIDLIKESIKLNDKDYSNYFILSKAYISKKDIKLAVEYLKKGIETRPEFKDFFKFLIYDRKKSDFEDIRELKEIKDIFK